MPLPSTGPAFGDSDIPTLLADMGIAISVGGVAGIGLLDEADEVLVQDAARGQVVVTMTTLTVRTTDFPNVAIDQNVQVGSTFFTVRERMRMGDGGLTKILLGNSTAVEDGGPFIGIGGSGPNLDGGPFAGAGGSGPNIDGAAF